MHQDSQNFSEIMAIDPTKQLCVELDIVAHGDITYEILLNGIKMTASQNTIHLHLFDEIDLSVKILENNNGAVEIKKLVINKKEILPLYQYLASKNTCWINEEGEWNYYITSPFYSWYHTASGQGWIA